MVCWLCREAIEQPEDSIKVIVGINSYCEERLFHKTCFENHRERCLRANHGGHHVSESAKN